MVGPTAVEDRLELGLTGMTCAACAARIEKVLNRVPGVHATVNFATEIAAVEFDPSLATSDQLIAAVARAGYGASVRRESEVERATTKARKQREYRSLRREVLVSTALTLPLLAQMVPLGLGNAATVVSVRRRSVIVKPDRQSASRTLRAAPRCAEGAHP